MWESEGGDEVAIDVYRVAAGQPNRIASGEGTRKGVMVFINNILSLLSGTEWVELKGK